MEYKFIDNQVICTCKSGYAFVIDASSYDLIKKYNWFFHKGRIEGNAGGKGERVMLTRILMNVQDKQVFVRQKVKGNDFRKDNLYLDNSYIDHGDYYEVVTQRGSFLIDKSSKPLIEAWHWRINTQDYAEAIIDGKRILLHRFLLGLNRFKSFDEVVDHINRDRKDNRLKNLRVVTQKENTRNGSGQAGRTSGVPGIYYDTHLQRWRGQRRCGDVVYTIGLHKTKESAINELARCDACILSGEPYISPKNIPPAQSGEKYIYKYRSGYTVCINGKYLGCRKSIEECIKLRDSYINSL